MQIGAQQLGDEVAAQFSLNDVMGAMGATYMSSSGEIKMSLKLMICKGRQRPRQEETGRRALRFRASDASAASAHDMSVSKAPAY